MTAKPRSVLGKVKPKPKVKAIRTKTYHVQLGTTDHPEHLFHYETENQARAAILKHAEIWRPWCQSRHRAGLVAIDQFRQALSATIYDRERQTVDVLLDDHTGVHLHVEIWRA